MRIAVIFGTQSRKGNTVIKLATISGPPSSGKTSVILKAIRALKAKGITTGVVKFDCLTTSDDALYRKAEVPVVAVMVTVVEADLLESCVEVAVIVTVATPGAAVGDAVNVATAVEVGLSGLNTAVTPSGNPLALNVTGPVNSPPSMMVIVRVTTPPELSLPGRNGP